MSVPAAPLAENGLPLLSDGHPLSEAEHRVEIRRCVGELEALGHDDEGDVRLAAWLESVRARIADGMTLGLGWRKAGLLACACDAAAICLFHRAVREHGLPRPPVAVAATGGYGRSALFPWSDVDLLVVPDPEARDCDAFLRTLHRRLFECFAGRLKLSVGYQYRDPAELADLDLTTRTSLLDLRRITGPERAYEALRDAVRDSCDRPTVLLSLLSERRRKRLGESRELYRLEPDLKTGPGGLRDLEYALWAGRLGDDSPEPLVWPYLEASGLVEEPRLERARRALSALFDLRFALHIGAGRKTDTLFLGQHEAVATILFPSDPSPLDALMSLRFGSGAELHALAESLVEACESRPAPAGRGLALLHGRIVGAATAELPTALAAAGLHARTGAPVAFTLRREIAARAHEVTAVTPESGACAFLALVESPRFATALRILRDLGAATALFPELAVAAGRVPYDPSHEHAIFEHSLRALEYLLALEDADPGREGALPKIWRDLSATERRILLIATWLHDMGKPIDRSDHSRAGAALCRQVGARLGLAPEETERAARLIELHLEMARRSALQDLDQGATIRQFADLVGDASTLGMLYLLTHADTRAVAESNLRDMDRRSQEELYARTLAVLAEEGMTESDLRAAAEQIRIRAVRELRIQGVSEDRIREHCEQMPPFYVVATPLGVLGAHIAMVRDLAREDRPILDFHSPKGCDYTELTVCCYDDPGPGLFSKLAGTLYALGVNVHSAQVRTRSGKRPIAIDSLVVDLRGRALPLDVQERVGERLTRVLTGRTSLAELLIQCRRPPPERPDIESVVARNDLSDDHTVIWVTAEDRVGLLFQLSHAFAECGLNLHSAKIATWAGKAENVYYVTDAQGRRLPESDLATVAARVRRVAEGFGS